MKLFTLKVLSWTILYLLLEEHPHKQPYTSTTVDVGQHTPDTVTVTGTSLK